MSETVIYRAACHFIDAGMSVIPANPDKEPFFRLLPRNDEGNGTWDPFKTEHADKDTLRRWFANGTNASVAIVGGEVSGNLEIIDFDRADVFDSWLELLTNEGADLADRLTARVKTRKGHHIYYRCDAIEGNLKLAFWYDEDEKRVKPLIETRGEGGYAVAPPSKGYRMLAGKLTDIPVITAGERDLLFELARSLNEYTEPERIVGGARPSRPSDGLRPGDDYNERGDISELLTAHGWTLAYCRGEKEYWRRPGKKRGHSATFNHIPGCFYNFSSSGAPFEAEETYKPFAVFALLEHAGDFKAAARALGAQGYGEQRGRSAERSVEASNEKNRPPTASDTDEPGVIVRDVERERVEWVWRGRIAYGKLNLIDGDPGAGKSTLITDVAARQTRGRPMPHDDGHHSDPAGVVFVSTEDGIGDTMRPRLEAAGADLSKCLVIQTVKIQDVDRETGEIKMVERVPIIPEDLPQIERGIKRVGARILVIDPLVAHLGKDVKANLDQDVRTALAPLSLMAERTGVAVVVIRHLNKMSNISAIYRGGGSIGITGAARSVMLIGKNPDNAAETIMARVKCNVYKPVPSLAFRLVESDEIKDVAVVDWLGESQLTADDLLRRPDGRYGTDKTDEAEEFLSDLLAAGPLMAVSIYERAEEAGISERTLKRAKRKLGITSERLEPGRSPWYWIPNKKLEGQDTGTLTHKPEKLGCQAEPLSHNVGTLTFKPENGPNDSVSTDSKNNKKLECQHMSNTRARGTLTDGDNEPPDECPF